MRRSPPTKPVTRLQITPLGEAPSTKSKIGPLLPGSRRDYDSSSGHFGIDGICFKTVRETSCLYRFCYLVHLLSREEGGFSGEYVVRPDEHSDDW